MSLAPGFVLEPSALSGSEATFSNDLQSPEGKERVGCRTSWVCFPGMQPVRVLCVRVRSCSRVSFLLVFLEGKHLTILWLLCVHTARGSLVAAVILSFDEPTRT